MNNFKQSFRKFHLLWSGQCILAIGSGLTAFGIAVYVFEQTGKESPVKKLEKEVAYV
ncbi:hypothetical protein [Lysinibacillus contaminans]|uniref:hypothetical protein n=1 Tax=Lysinibacillus contaminans TaxID=1293441 RepID=UPI000A5E5BA2|nr:hypothetical protein [Lysinibacillus contaminans]